MIVDDPQEYYRRFQNNKRIEMFNYHFRRWLIYSILMSIYIVILIVLYGIGLRQKCGYYMNSLVLSEIVIKLTVLLYETAIIFLMRYLNLWMYVHKVSNVVVLISMLLWNSAILLDFCLSITNCSEKSWVLLAASIWMVIQCIVWICICCLLKCILSLESCFVSRSTRRSNGKQMSEIELKHLLKILSKLKKMDATDKNFSPDQDKCCICLEIMKKDSKIIVLPCHRKHCMHYDCIARWTISDPRCPICKEDITLESVVDKIEEMTRLRLDTEGTENQM